MSTRCRPSLQIAAAAFGLAGLIGVGVSVALPTVVLAQTGLRSPTLEQRLLFGLQARRPSEKAFVQAVVDSVDRGTLPKRLVDRTFFWARSRSPKQVGRSSRRPIIYFQPALTIQANRLGIHIRRD